LIRFAPSHFCDDANPYWSEQTKDHVAIEASGGDRDGPTKENGPGDGHSGEGTASLRPGLARRLAESALRVAGRQSDNAISRAAPLTPEQVDQNDSNDPGTAFQSCSPRKKPR